MAMELTELWCATYCAFAGCANGCGTGLIHHVRFKQAGLRRVLGPCTKAKCWFSYCPLPILALVVPNLIVLAVVAPWSFRLNAELSLRVFAIGAFVFIFHLGIA